MSQEKIRDGRPMTETTGGGIEMTNCPKCGSHQTISCGDFIKVGKQIIRHRKCIYCGKCFKEEAK